jgi:Xaa-Pro aminopeptidase
MLRRAESQQPIANSRPMNYPVRQQKFLHCLFEKKLDAFLVTHTSNLSYLCGFTGSTGALLASSGRWTFFTDGRYTQQARAEVCGARVVIRKGPVLAAVAAALEREKAAPRLPARALGFESGHLSVASRSSLASLLPKRVRLRAVSGLVENLRLIKESEEIARLRAAAQAGSCLFDSVLAIIKPGVPETSVAGELEYAARRAGVAGMSFDTIVASGPRSALPHGRASGRPIARRGFVVLDFGVILRNYCSDMTRTVHMGRPSREMGVMYEAVREAEQAGIDSVRHGVMAREVDRAVRKVLRRAGLVKYFTHSTGHGVGLEVHEPPRLSRDSQFRLEAGMVITIEPGVYLPGKGGVRIEDMVLVTANGAEVLTAAPRELIQL